MTENESLLIRNIENQNATHLILGPKGLSGPNNEHISQKAKKHHQTNLYANYDTNTGVDDILTL